MTAASYAAVDWGTTSFRLWLVGENGDVLAERRSHEGMTSAAKTGFSPILESHLAAVGAPAHLPVVICGMAGARQGWVEAGYLDTPAPLSGIVGACVLINELLSLSGDSQWSRYPTSSCRYWLPKLISEPVGMVSSWLAMPPAVISRKSFGW